MSEGEYFFLRFDGEVLDQRGSPSRQLRDAVIRLAVTVKARVCVIVSDATFVAVLRSSCFQLSSSELGVLATSHYLPFETAISAESHMYDRPATPAAVKLIERAMELAYSGMHAKAGS